MRLDRLLTIAAAVALVAACNQPTADRNGAARAPIPAAQPSTAQPPAAQAAKADCPCPKASKAKAGPRRKAVVHKASHRTAAKPQRRTYRRYEALAGGPPSRSEYARVPPEYYVDGPATSYRYGPAYPPAPPAYRDYDNGRRDYYRYERGDEGRYDDRRSGYEERGGRYEDRRDGYEDRRAWREPAPPPPPAHRYGPEHHQRWEDGRSYERGSAYDERYSSRDDYVRREPPPPPAPRHGYSERRAYEGRYEERSESSSSYESRSESRGGPCCRSEAAGFDANGFLTWPGKVPARP